jgi:hypothetical protein
MANVVDSILSPYLDQMKPINTTFRELVPWENVVNPGLIDQFANEQVNNDAYARAASGYRNTMGSLYGSGGNRFGAAKQIGQNTLNQYERQRQDELSQFRNLMAGNLGATYRQYEQDYNEDPNAGYVASFVEQYKNLNPEAFRSLNNQLGQSLNSNPLSAGYSPLQGTFRGYNY